ncbi:DNA-binding transcriptional regulator YbjK [Geodermatophilus bullaregiensis]|uniref:TetR/AcrR family transcriptional regulator n=1 Tax=Geodermatophilus bullaregiensis TaxID=1564160 RepID=UPI00195BB019|nr:TetR family transcriptional regulator [Geodermatophilus bullaregiensis]MBM7804897.1 DNA-binding transcriptional regulator YbjK [Geodermatophilus bullaregiensis]
MTGLTAKGRARRAAIVETAARLVLTDGPDALSHRAVASASGLPLAATTYYFDSLDDLRTAAVEQVVRAEVAEAEQAVAALPRRARSAAATARLVADVVLGPGRHGDEELHSLYERFLACGRHPALRPVLRSARARIDAALTETLDRCGHAGADVTTLVALVDGSVVSALVEGDGSARRRAEEAVTAALS